MSVKLFHESNKDIVAEILKITRKRKIKAADRREIEDLLWMLQKVVEAPKLDYNEDYTKRALRTEHTRAFVVGPDGKPDLRLSKLLHAVLGLVTETGELADALKKSIVYDRPLDEINLIEEAGDLKWYQALLHRELGKTDREIGELNVQKLLVRYPEKFSSEQATKRDLVAERAVFEKALNPAPAKVSKAVSTIHKWGEDVLNGNVLCVKCGAAWNVPAGTPCNSAIGG